MKKRSGRGIKVKPAGGISPGCVMMVFAKGFSIPTRVEREKNLASAAVDHARNQADAQQAAQNAALEAMQPEPAPAPPEAP